MLANKHIHGIIISPRLFIYLLALSSNSSLAGYCHLSIHQSTFPPLSPLLSLSPPLPMSLLPIFVHSFSLPLFVNVILLYFFFLLSFLPSLPSISPLP